MLQAFLLKQLLKQYTGKSDKELIALIAEKVKDVDVEKILVDYRALLNPPKGKHSK